jgi:hypothetical protein
MLIAACALLASAAAAAAAEGTVIGHSVQGRPIVVVRNGEAGTPSGCW